MGVTFTGAPYDLALRAVGMIRPRPAPHAPRILGARRAILALQIAS
ncbi:MAG: hypothetical protein U5N55_06410 [Cypionkella sp.]|nr:hypothetical protein [Cypionkella sp.]